MRSSLAASLLCCLFALTGTAMALTVPTVNTAVSFSGNPNSVQFTGGAPKYRIERSYSVDAGATWSPRVRVATNDTGLYVHYSPDQTKWWRYQARSVDESTDPDTLSGLSAPFYAPNWREDFIPLSDAGAAAYVITRETEIRGTRSGSEDNVAENAYVPNSTELNAFKATRLDHDPGSPTVVENNAYLAFVTGNSTLSNPSTGDLIAWAAHKWGIPVDVMRAIAANGARWFQDARSSLANGVVATDYPAHSRIDSDTVYEALGIAQILWRPDGSRNPGTEPLRWKSTAFALDYLGAMIRWYRDSLCTWCDDTVEAGHSYPSVYPHDQNWMSAGAYASPAPWGNAEQLAYIAELKSLITAREWAKTSFRDELLVLSASSLFADNFATPNGCNNLITNKYAYYNAYDAQRVTSPHWEVTAGSFFSVGGVGWTGVPDSTPPDPDRCSTNKTGSWVFRMRSKRSDFGSTRQEVEAKINGFYGFPPSRPAQAWDGVVIWPRYVTEEHLYFAYILRKDGLIALTKKVPLAGSYVEGNWYDQSGNPVAQGQGGQYYNGGLYYYLIDEFAPSGIGPPVLGTWYQIGSSVKDEANGSVTIKLYRGGTEIASYNDDGLGASGPVVAGPAKVGLRADNTDANLRNYVITEQP